MIYRTPRERLPKLARWVVAFVVLVPLTVGCGSTRDLGLAPVSYGGSVRTIVAQRYSSDGSSTIATGVTGSLGFQSYIWHPWFATVSGGFDLGYDYSTGQDSDATLRAGGNLNLNVLPSSRYPVSLSLSHQEGWFSGELVGNTSADSASLSVGAVIMPGLKTGLSTSFQRTTDADDGVNTQMQADFSVNKSFSKREAFLGVQTIDFQFGVERGEFSASDVNESDKSVDNANLQLQIHSKPSDTLAIDTRLSAGYRVFTDANDEQTRMFAQGLTTVHWRPESLPFSVTGSLRTFWQDYALTREDGTQKNTVSLASMDIGMRWPINNNLSVNFGVRAGYNDSSRDEGIDLADGENDETGARLEAGFLAGIAYRSDQQEIAGFKWNWNAGLQANNGFDTEDGFESGETLGVGHSIGREIDGLFFWPLRFSASQSLNLSFRAGETGDPFQAGASHAITLAFNKADRDSSTFGQISIRDSRTLVGDGGELQAIFLRLGRREALNRGSRLAGTLNARASRRVSVDGDTIFSTNLTAEASYELQRPFDIDGMYFQSTLRTNIFDLGALFGGGEEVTADLGALSNDWRNVLTYRIGRLSAEAEASAFHRSGGFGYVVMLRLSRSFGGTI